MTRYLDDNTDYFHDLWSRQTSDEVDEDLTERSLRVRNDYLAGAGAWAEPGAYTDTLNLD